MNELIEKLLGAKIEHEKNWGKEADVLFINPCVFEGLMKLPEVKLEATNNGAKVFGCDYIFVDIEGFEVFAATHELMRRISIEHMGTTDDIKLHKLRLSGNSMEDKSDTITWPEYLTIPYYILDAYRRSCEQTEVDNLW